MKTRLIFLTSATILVALVFSGVVFAEGEVPQAPATEVPQAPSAEEPQAPTAEVPPEIPAESPTPLEEAIIVEDAPPPAEDEPAPEEPVVATPVQPAEGEIGTEPAPAGTEVLPEAPVIEVAPVEEVLPVVEAPVVLEAAPEVLIPDQTTFEVPVVVTAEPEILLVDPSGEPLDMASQASAQVIASADPYFTVGLITYRFSEATDYCLNKYPEDAHCFDGSSTPAVEYAIQAAINYISDILKTPPNDGKIYVQQAEYDMDSFTLTIDGSKPGLTTLNGLIGEANESTGVFPKIVGNVSISHLNNGFTLSGFTINGRVDIDGVSGTLTLTDLEVSKDTGGGIWVHAQKGNVVMTNVTSSHNAVTGADITNTFGGNVTITNSAFDDNGTTDYVYGLLISTNGVVTINGISASRNYNTGIDLSGFSSLTLKNAVINNNKTQWGLRASSTKAAPVVLQNVTANYNPYTGLYITTKGSISLSSIDAHHNPGVGIYLNNNTGTGTISLTSVRSSNNGGDGIQALSNGAITLTSVTADQNGGTNAGAYLDNSSGTGGITVTSPTASGFAGANSFSGNTPGCGLKILSKGAVLVTNVIANSNQYDGLNISNVLGTAGITINRNLANWTNDFSGNGYAGIKITTQGVVNISSSKASNNQRTGVDVTGKGTITLTDVEASTNGLAASGEFSGLKLTNTSGTGGVTIKSSVASQYLNFNNNYYYGIAIYSNGVVAVSNVTINNTQSKYGLLIENQTSNTAAVSLSNCKFDLNNWSGVNVKSKGVITLTNVTSTNSKNYSGATLDNSTGISSGVTIRSSLTSVFYEFSKNSGSGIEINTNGAVALSNVIADKNDSSGISIPNNFTSILPVTLTNCLANGNGADGIVIVSKGAVTLTNCGASGNIAGNGVYINNSSGTSAVAIKSTISTTYYDFSSNGQNGIRISSKGAVTVSNANASENGNYGLKIARESGTGSISITRGSFNSNGYGGIELNTTPSAIILTDVSASYNDLVRAYSYPGVHINATYGAPGGSVTVKSSLAAKRYDFSYNSKNGLEIYSSGPVSVSNVTAEGNIGPNVYIANTYAAPAAPKPVTVANSVANGSETVSGFEIYSLGTVTLTSLTANDNARYGLSVDAQDSNCLIPANVTLSGIRNEFSGNGSGSGDDGVRITTEGNISLLNVIADNNAWRGINLNNDFIGAVGNVTITASTNFWNSSSSNDGYGLEIRTRGTVTLSRLHANENGDYGILIQNDYSEPLIKNVTLTSVDANRNRGEHGLYIISAGAVTLNSTHVDSNEQSGLEIHTKGLVTLNGVSASYNSTHEADILSANATIYERLTSDSEGDIWNFVGTSSAYTISLTSSDFDAYLKLFHLDAGKWVLIESNNNSAGGTNALISIPGGLVNGDEYYILATTSDGWGIAGDYILSFNGPGTTYPLQKYIGARIDNQLGTGSVTITSPTTLWSSFSENNDYGLLINTSKAVSITNTDARDNASDGLWVVEYYYPTGITIRNTLTTRIMSFSGNGGTGINVPGAYGAITISGLITASNNVYDGAYLVNDGVSTPMPITISSLTASGNQGAGMFVDSMGAVTLTNITANDNQSTDYGICIYNDYFGMPGSVTLNGSNVISNNKGDGLEISTNGVLSITGVRAENNSNSGLLLASTTDEKTVTLSNIIAQYNGNTGLDLDAKGTTTLTNVRSSVNGTTGFSADGINITISGIYHTYINNSTAIGNTGSGIRINKLKSLLHLLGTFYFGNNSDNLGTEKDLDYFIPS